MGSDASPAWWTGRRAVAAFVWIFGCAAYYYARFTWTFVDTYGGSLRDLLAPLMDAIAVSSR